MCARRSRRIRTLAAITAAPMLLGGAGAARAVEQRIEWTNMVNVTLRGGHTLQKTGGCMGCDDATAVSRQMIRSGNGYVEFTVGEPYTFWMAGLTQSDGNVHYNTIDFAFRFNANETADVMENGQYQGSDTVYAVGDRFRIAVVNGRVVYTKNGSVVLESRQSPRYPMVLAVALGTSGSTIGNARIDTSNRAFTDDSYYNESDRYAFDRIDSNNDGVIARREWTRTRREFNMLDANGDGVVSAREFRRGTAGGFGGVGTSGQLITVNPTQRWTDTGMWVEAGDMVTIDAEGSIQMSSDAGDTATPAGSRTGRRAADAPMRNLSAGLLLARIGNAGVFAAGDRRTARTPVSGVLYLGVNDDFLEDNRGEYRVSVTVQR